MTTTDTAPAAETTERPTLTAIHHLGITVDDLGIMPAAQQKQPTPGGGRRLEDVVEEAEKQAIEATLRECDGNREEAAKRLGISATTLWRKMTRMSITYPG